MTSFHAEGRTGSGVHVYREFAFYSTEELQVGWSKCDPVFSYS